MTALSSADQNRRPADPVRRSTRPKSPFALSSVSNMATAWSSVAQANQPLSIRARNKGDRPPLTYVPLLEQELRARKRPVGPSWRMDETYVRVKGTWKYLYRAVDKAGATVDFLLTAKRDRKAALRFLRKAI